MIQVSRFALLSVALAAGLPAVAQNADVDPNGPSVGVNRTLFDNGAAGTKAAFMYVNGGVDPLPGGCVTDFSAIEAGLNTYGLGHQVLNNNLVADDFTVPAGEAWTLTDMKWLAYQTGAPSTGTITDIVVNVVPGADPNGAALAGGGSHFVSQTFSGISRTTATATTDCARHLIEVTADMSWVPVLAPGQYWITVQCDGTLASGPWCPPTVPWLGTDNGQQSIAGGLFAPLIQGQGGAPVDFPFTLNGDDGAGGGASYYCSQSKATTVAGCTASLTVTDLSLATGTWNTTNIPRAAGLGTGTALGIYIYTNAVGAGQSAFSANINFGTLCLAGFKRSSPACSPATLPGALAGVCNSGNLSTAVNCNAGALGIAVGQDVNVQLWYRDPGAVGDADFSNAAFYTVQ
jgi:hypothetical protein